MNVLNTRPFDLLNWPTSTTGDRSDISYVSSDTMFTVRVLVKNTILKSLNFAQKKTQVTLMIHWLLHSVLPKGYIQTAVLLFKLLQKDFQIIEMIQIQASLLSKYSLENI